MIVILNSVTTFLLVIVLCMALLLPNSRAFRVTIAASASSIARCSCTYSNSNCYSYSKSNCYSYNIRNSNLFSHSVRKSAKNINRYMSSRSLETFGLGENTLLKYLIAEDVEATTGDKIKPRQVKKIHYTPVLPEPVEKPYLIAASRNCADYLQLNSDELTTERFVDVFVGNELLPGLDQPYCTVYGCHCYGQWFGQLGDGRAISIGEVHIDPTTTINEEELGM